MQTVVVETETWVHDSYLPHEYDSDPFEAGGDPPFLLALA